MLQTENLGCLIRTQLYQQELQLLGGRSNTKDNQKNITVFLREKPLRPINNIKLSSRMDTFFKSNIDTVI